MTVIDVFTRECPLLAADTSPAGNKVAELLGHVALKRGYPKTITVDNGNEHLAKKDPVETGAGWRGEMDLDPW